MSDILDRYINDELVSEYFIEILKDYERVLSTYIPNATDIEIEKYHLNPTTKVEKEENYLITSTIKARGAKEMGQTETWFNKPKEPHEKQTLGLLMMITAFYGENFKNVELAKNAFRKHLCEILENTEDNLRVLLDDIKYLWEYETVLSSVYQFGYGNATITNLPKKSPQQVREEKLSYEREKSKVITFLKKYNLNVKEVKEHIFEPDKIYLNRHYRQTLKLAKEMLTEELITHNKVGKRRAREIAKILDYI